MWYFSSVMEKEFLDIDKRNAWARIFQVICLLFSPNIVHAEIFMVCATILINKCQMIFFVISVARTIFFFIVWVFPAWFILSLNFWFTYDQNLFLVCTVPLSCFFYEHGMCWLFKYVIILYLSFQVIHISWFHLLKKI